MQMPSRSVVGIEQGVARQAAGELPLAMDRPLGIEIPSRVAERLTPRIEETHSDAAGEHATSVESSDIEASGRLWPDPLPAEEGCVRIQPEPSCEGSKGPRPRHGMLPTRPRIHRRAGEGSEIHGGRPVAAALETPRQLDDVPTGVAAGKAAPEIFVPMDDEGTGIVAAVDRAGAHPARSSRPHSIQPALVGEHMENGNRLFKPPEIELRRNHPASPDSSLASLPSFLQAQPCGSRRDGPSIRTVWQRWRSRLRRASTIERLPRNSCHSSYSRFVVMMVDRRL